MCVCVCVCVCAMFDAVLEEEALPSMSQDEARRAEVVGSDDTCAQLVITKEHSRRGGVAKGQGPG